jgi:carboxyl-terminal processing protease
MPWTLATSKDVGAVPANALAQAIAGLVRTELQSELKLPGKFGDCRSLHVVLPSQFDGLAAEEVRRLQGLRALLESNRTPLESELGARVSFGDDADATNAQWLIGPTRCTPELEALGLGEPARPSLRLLPHQQRLITDAPTVPGIFESLSLLRSASWTPGDVLESAPCRSEEDAFIRVAQEVAHTWPSFRRRGLVWLDLCYRYAQQASAGAFAAARRMVTELEDAHTAIRKADAWLPANVRARALAGHVVLHEVPEGSAAWESGAREGFTLLDAELEHVWEFVGATPHHRPFAVPYRMLCGVPGAERELAARGPRGEVCRWRETYVMPAPRALVSWRRLPNGVGYLRVRQWPSSDAIAALVDHAFDDLASAPALVVDLRGNPGGDISVASSFRDRFLRERTHLGSIQFTSPEGELLPAEPIWAEPAAPERRWHGPVRFLTDPGTYSASEDALLGLQGLDHVRVVGMPSGGGSGRARSVSLLPGWRLSVSSCLTFDRQNRCIEGAGIPLDHTVPMDRATHSAWEQELLSLAASG